MVREGPGPALPARSVLGIVNRPGAFAEYVTLPVENLHKVPDEISDPVATFTSRWRRPVKSWSK